MDLPVGISSSLSYQVNLPQSFLNYLLGEGYQFDQGILCLKLTSMFGSCYVCMNEFTSDQETINIGYEVNSLLNAVEGDYIHIETTDSTPCEMVKIQGHRESFGEVEDIKEKLEELFTSIKIINKGVQLLVTGPSGPELFTIVDILDKEEKTMDWFLSVNTDVKIDFLPTIESIEKEKKEQERKELEERGFIGEGKRLGGNNTFDREAWLNRLSGKKD